ncbi:hypothetical protein A1O3_06514 [Capronia epimyces CBS 606.96]|uniref:Major facilitator superfamily (MFS) profile domain-containing protein n=1 Tax=Capronia epimyces CBS 606.96 TaxID=1182542 RepID=W9XZ84_9EURO|nr:uncharacterized protein A1O3_06514 [Capronia epimyces CBS 606.96]EXJ82700.1 hypothetical protein A1O3_06514 [Capronia epimyces CBS 606.96]
MTVKNTDPVPVTLNPSTRDAREAVAASDGLPDQHEYPPLTIVLISILAMMLATLLVALDRTIIATAIPVITNHFDSLADVGWYASAYLLTQSAFQLFMGRVYTFYNPKWVFIACVAIFELGSLVCGVAPNSTTLIVGRAIAGMGSAGIFSGAITIVTFLVPLRKRPAWTGSLGAVFAIASVAGPLLGGVFTDKVNWRWCFYINLPAGGVTMVILAFVLRLPHIKREKVPLRQQINQLDPLGTAVFIPAIVCLLLALEWGGTEYGWSSVRIIVLLVLAVVLFVGFVAIQIWRQEMATIPPRIIMNRSVAAGVTYAFLSGAGMVTMVYFLPIWFQAIKGASAVHSGIMNLPAILGLTMASMLAGFGTRRFGYFTLWMYLSTILTPIGAGLISTFTTTTSHPKWIGYQVLWGFGLGLGMQQPSVAAQTVLARKDVAIGISVIFFANTLGGSIFVSVANNIFDNKLAQGLKTIPGINPDLVGHVGATDLRDVVPTQSLNAVLTVYNAAIRHAFYVGVAVSAATVIGSLAMEWKNLKTAAAAQDAAANANAAALPGDYPGSSTKTDASTGRPTPDEKKIGDV